MRVALVLDRFDPARGGLESWTWDLAQWLRGRGHHVHVVASEFAAGSLSNGIEGHSVESEGSRLDRAAAVERRLLELGADIVHDTGTGWYFDVLQPQSGCCVADWRQNLASHVWYRRPRFALNRWRRRRFRERRALEQRQFAARRGVIVAVSQMVASQLEAAHGVDSGRIRVIPNGVDTSRFTPADRERHRAAIRAELRLQDEPVFLLAAHNPSLKGAPYALAAMARLARDDRSAHLVIIGRAEVEPYRTAARNLGIADRCSFPGFVPAAAPYYAAADVYLHPSFYDPCSLSVLEAWAAGIPAITTRFNGAAELMTVGQHGLIVDDPADVTALASAMRRLLDRSAREAMSPHCRALAAENSSARNFERVFEAYEWARERRAAENWEA